MREASDARPEADDPDRRPADPLARHEVLRALRLHRLRPLPRLQGRGRSSSTSSPTTRRWRTTSCSRDGGAEVELLKTRHPRLERSRSSTRACTPSIGERLQRGAQHLLGDDEMFLANYGDRLTDAPLPAMIEHARARATRSASFLARRARTTASTSSRSNDDGVVDGISDVTTSDIWINGGYFVFRREIFDYIARGRGPRRGAVPAADRRASKLLAHRYEGFWAPMDTLKDKQRLESLHRERRGAVGASGSRRDAAATLARAQPPG